MDVTPLAKKTKKLSVNEMTGRKMNEYHVEGWGWGGRGGGLVGRGAAVALGAAALAQVATELAVFTASPRFDNVFRGSHCLVPVEPVVLRDGYGMSEEDAAWTSSFLADPGSAAGQQADMYKHLDPSFRAGLAQTVAATAALCIVAVCVQTWHAVREARPGLHRAMGLATIVALGFHLIASLYETFHCAATPVAMTLGALFHWHTFGILTAAYYFALDRNALRHHRCTTRLAVRLSLRAVAARLTVPARLATTVLGAESIAVVSRPWLDYSWGQVLAYALVTLVAEVAASRV
jgi:hypothetical protein